MWEKMAGGPGVAPSYVDLESTRSHIDPPPIRPIVPSGHLIFPFTRPVF